MIKRIKLHTQKISAQEKNSEDIEFKSVLCVSVTLTWVSDCAFLES